MTPAGRAAPVLSAEQQAVVSRAAEAVRMHTAACEAAQDVTPDAAQALRGSGYTRLTLPPAEGGLGASLAAFAQAQLTLGEQGASLALVLAMHGHVTGAAFQGRTLPDELLAALAGACRRGELVNALASEPELGSPSRGGLPRTAATPDGAGWRISGRKTWSTGARALHWALVHSALPDGRVGRFWVDLRGEGVHLEPTWQGALALRGSGSHDVVFEGAPAPLWAPAEPHPASSAWFWTAVAATYLGVGFAALHALTTYAHERVPTALGAPLATLPRLQEGVGRLGAGLLAARELLFHAAACWDAAPGPDALPLLGAAKALCTNAAVDATDHALRLAGGAALTPALPLERLLRDARAGLTHPPADDRAYEALGAALLASQGPPPSPTP
ncbi:acyl-CoA dehydrogenase family protein [Deinococcus multiflagellatus]|uniref:Acyl-CoA dehydrogenase family protein n=1 Tax=Deinococcus multiflagellatus TaxID=1656887 RepID=A0ABW1ZQL9_9DEIO|nr:acyl-CoA dehydrogenase family protein [Deinococcus multiflagellatus]MBZ9715899.1 acyl-CoA/acyl-ACP dehydrogenase [Deinococcus multiflagellatus]